MSGIKALAAPTSNTAPGVIDNRSDEHWIRGSSLERLSSMTGGITIRPQGESQPLFDIPVDVYLAHLDDADILALDDFLSWFAPRLAKRAAALGRADLFGSRAATFASRATISRSFALPRVTRSASACADAGMPSLGVSSLDFAGRSQGRSALSGTESSSRSRML